MYYRSTTNDDLLKIIEIINSVPLPNKVFIKNTKEYIEEKGLLKNSYALVDANKEIVAVLLLDYNNKYIDTIISLRKGCGTAILKTFFNSKEGKGKFKVNISPLNMRSIRLFKRFGFKITGSEMVEGEVRLIYEANIR